MVVAGVDLRSGYWGVLQVECVLGTRSVAAPRTLGPGVVGVSRLGTVVGVQGSTAKDHEVRVPDDAILLSSPVLEDLLRDGCGVTEGPSLLLPTEAGEVYGGKSQLEMLVSLKRVFCYDLLNYGHLNIFLRKVHKLSNSLKPVRLFVRSFILQNHLTARRALQPTAGARKKPPIERLNCLV